ncbi:hypothetical protein II906_00895 [bacterium]|nr:hypothetical protein [bacterium]
MKISPINGYISTQSIAKLNPMTSFMSAPNVQKADSVSFTSKGVKKPVNVDLKTAEDVAYSLSHSTSGHRAPYGGETFNKDIVQLITLGIADYAKDEAAKNGKKHPTVLIGGDTRQATRESLPLINETFKNQNVDVIYIKDPVPTPLLALAAKNLDVDTAVLMTASHNPWGDGGYNMVTKAGAVAPAEVTEKVAEHMVKIAKKGTFVEYPENSSKETDIYPIEMYKEHIDSLGLVDFDKIRNAGISLHYDGLKGTGPYVLPDLLKSEGIPCHEVISGDQEGPNPTDGNLTELKKSLAADKSGGLKVGISNDGDADRFGIVDENGKFITANDVLLLASYHLANNKGKEGTIIRSQATTAQLDGIAENYGLDVLRTPVGFKYIAEDILDLRKQGKDALLAGEESGGLTVTGHLPEKDGILADLLVLDLIATEQKPISEILSDVKASLPKNYEVDNFSQRYPSPDKQKAVMDRFIAIHDAAKKGQTQFDEGHVIDLEATKENDDTMKTYKKGGDGVKLYMTDGSTILVRKSGTEPVLRCYIEAAGENQEAAAKNKDALKETMVGIFTI